MNTFADIYGYDKIKEHLQNAIKLNKVSHAYIFNGSLGADPKEEQTGADLGAWLCGGDAGRWL